MKHVTRGFVTIFVLILAASSALSQLSGVKTIPGDYATLSAAITDLNTQGVGAGGVTFNVAAGYTETLPSLTAGLITATGTSGNPVVFQKSGGGANPLITAFSPGVSTSVDYILAIAGGDYITFDGIDLLENASNTTPTQQMEWGYALVKKQAAAPFDGCDNVTIKNCTITLSRLNTASSGIYLGNHVSTVTTALTITATTDAHNNNKFYSNTIQNCTNGIWMSGFAAAATPYTLYDQSNDIGGSAPGTGNIIRDFGGTTTTAYGVYGAYQNNLNVRYNTVADSATASGVSSGGVLYGIYHGAATNSSTTLSNNTVTITKGANTSAVYGIYSGAAGTGTTTISNNSLQSWTSNGSSGAIYFIYSGATTGTETISNNTISNNTALNTTGSCYFIYNSNSTPNITCSGNTINNNSKTGAGGTVYGYYNFGSPGSGTSTHTGNNITNITLTGATGFYGIYQASSVSQNEILTGNTVSNIVGGTSAIYGLYLNYGAAASTINGNTVFNMSGASTVYGIQAGNTSSSIALSVYQNTVHTLSSSGASAVYGIYHAGTTGLTTNSYQNNVYDLSGSNAGSLIYGLYVASGTNMNLYNNFVSDLRATVATGTNAIVGMYIAGGTTVGAYFNTVFLNATTTSATTFGTSGVYASTTPTVELRNNVIVNLSAPGPTGGFTVAHRRSSITLTTYSSSSNSNDFYVNPALGVQRYYYSDGTAATNCDSTFAAYKARVASRDAASFAENPPFVNVGATPYDLHMQTTIPTQTESGGSPVTTPVAITVDYDGNTRNVSTPDVGADEFAGLLLDLSPPVISYTPLGNTASTANRSFTPVPITDATGVNTTAGTRPRVYYKRVTDANTWNDNTSGTAGWKYAEASGGGGSPFSFTIDYSLLSGGAGVVVGDSVQYLVVAQDVTPAVNVGINSGVFAATPASVALTAAAFPITGSINFYAILGSISGTFTVGTAGTYPTITAAVADLNNKVMVGSVTFLLNDATYPTETFPLTINQNSGSSVTNTLTIKPNAGVTTTVSGSSASSIFRLNGADYVTLDGSNSGTNSKNMTISNTSAVGSTAAIWVSSLGAGLGATNNTIKNCIVSGGARTTSGIYGIIVGGSTIGSTGADNDNITIQNNSISRAYVGIWAQGSAATNPGLMDNIQIVSNLLGAASPFDSLGHDGIMVANGSGGTISQNTISNIVGTPTTPVGITISTGFVSATISRNKIYNIVFTGTGGYGGRGMYVSTGNASSNLAISNNAVYVIGGDGYTSFTNSSPVGMYFDGTTGGLQIYFNSVYMSGNLTFNGLTLTAGILFYTSTVTNVDMRNNVFQNSLNNTANAGAKNYAIYSNAPNTSFATINYNDYYVTGTQGILGYLGADRTTITDWRTATGQDANSLGADPILTATTDLEPQFGSPLLAGGVGGTGITIDILGNLRGSPPTIGAYENAVGDVIGPLVLYTPLTSTASTSNRTLVSVITDASLVAGGGNAPRIYYRKGAAGAYAFANATTVTDSHYTFTINYASIGGVTSGDTVQYYVAAQDQHAPANLATVPSGGSGINPPGTTPPPVPNSYTILVQISTYPYTEDFEGTLMGPKESPKNSILSGGFGWTTGIYSGTINEWTRGTPAKPHIAGAHSGTKAYFVGAGTTYLAGENAYLQSPIFNMTSLSGTPKLEFWHNFYSEPGWDAGILEVSTDGGLTWSRVDSTVGTGGNFTTTNSFNWYNSASTSGPITPNKWSGYDTVYVGHSAGWIKSTTKLVGLGGLPDVRLRFRFGSDGSIQYEGWAIDDVSILPALANDIATNSVDNPSGGQTKRVNQAFSPKATFSNPGSATQNSIPVRLKILDGTSTVVYLNNQTVGSLAPDAVQQVTFSAFTPTTVGAYTARAIALNPGDLNGANDSVEVSFSVIDVPVFLTRVDSLTKSVPPGGKDSTTFYVRNTGGVSGGFTARAIMYPPTDAPGKKAQPLIIPLTVKPVTANPVSFVPALPEPPKGGAGTSGPSRVEVVDRSPFGGSGHSSSSYNPLALYDLQFDYDASAVTGAAGNAAAIFFENAAAGGKQFWTSRWQLPLGQINRWHPDGTLWETFTIPLQTGSGIRALTYDGQYLYGSTNSAKIYKIDPVTKTIVDSITCQGGVTTRMLSYDPVRDGFWTSNFTGNISCVSRTGAIIATIPATMAAKYGSAYDPYSPGGPYLWVFDQTNTLGGTPQNIYKLDMTTGARLDSFNVLLRVTTGGATPIAGGLFISTGIATGKVTLGGLLQGVPDRLFGLELADAGSWLSVAPSSGTLAVGDSVQMKAYFDASDTSISNHPGNYYGRIEVTAGSPLADSLRIPARMTVGSTTTTVNIGIASGWNMIANPVTNPVPDDSVKHLYPTINTTGQLAFAFLPPSCISPPNGYQSRPKMVNGAGYWGRFPAAITNPITGTPRTRDSMTVCTGWNMVGSISNTVDTSTIVSVPTGLRASNWFGYAGGYTVVTQITPGKAYWIKSNANGKFVMANPLAGGPAKVQTSEEGALDALNTLTITDSKGGSQTLYFGADAKNEIELPLFDMPPAPPIGVLDARFETAEGGSMVRTHGAKESEPVEFAVRIQSGDYPVTVTWELKGGTASYELTDGVGGRVFRAMEMTKTGSVKITNSELSRITVRLVGNGQLPTEYALSQNYPNPFNPTTSIKYDLPVDSKVMMEIYNVIGQRVRTLVNDDIPAGYHTIDWNGTGNESQQLASGVYFLKMSATGTNGKTFGQIRKLMMLK